MVRDSDFPGVEMFAAHDDRVFVQGQPVDFYPDRAPQARRGRCRRITEIGEQVLRTPCVSVTEFDTDDLRQLISDMFVTMYVASGVGLAANQIGVGLRVFVYDCADDAGVRHVGHMVNPVLEVLPDIECIEVTEGCLSVPGARESLARPARAAVTGVDQHGELLRLDGGGYFARCLVHETGHLNGELYVDHLSKRARKDALRQMDAERDTVYGLRRSTADRLGVEFVGGPAT